MPDKEFLKHVRSVVESLGSGEKGPPSQRRVHLLHYAASIATNPAVATALVLTNVLAVCGHQIRDCPNPDVWVWSEIVTPNNVKDFMYKTPDFRDWFAKKEGLKASIVYPKYLPK